MTARRCRDDMIERSDSAERIEATLAKDPMANAEANDPIEPMDRNDPTLPIDRIEFFDPIDRIEFSDRIEHQLPWLVTNEDYGSRHGGGIRDLSGATGAARGADGRRQPARGPHPSLPMQAARPCGDDHPRRSLFGVARRGCCWAGLR